MEVVYVPGTTRDTPFRDLLTAADPGRFYDSYPFDVRPVSDNRPFFFYTVQPRDLWKFLQSASRRNADFKINSAVPVLFGLMAISIVATLIILSLPPLVLRHGLPRGKGVVPALFFFLVYRRGLHSDSGRPDSEVRAVSGPSHLRADGNYFFDADLERLGELLE